MIREAILEITETTNDKVIKSLEIIVDGEEIPLSDLFKRNGNNFIPASGWIGHIEIQ